MVDTEIVKLLTQRAGLPGNELSFLIVPLDPAYKAGLAGHIAGQGLGEKGRRRFSRPTNFSYEEAEKSLKAADRIRSVIKEKIDLNRRH